MSLMRMRRRRRGWWHPRLHRRLNGRWFDGTDEVVIPFIIYLDGLRESTFARSRVRLVNDNDGPLLYI